MIIRVKHDKQNPYVVINKKQLQRKDLSFRARGLYAYLLSLPDNWCINVSHLQKQTTDGKHAVRSALNELRTAGFIKTVSIREHGKMVGREIIFSENPNDFTDVPIFRTSGNQRLISNDIAEDLNDVEWWENIVPTETEKQMDQIRGLQILEHEQPLDVPPNKMGMGR